MFFMAALVPKQALLNKIYDFKTFLNAFFNHNFF